MMVLGLTGSLGAGKSTVAQLLADAGAAVFDADATVHDLYRGDAVAVIGEAFPGTIRDGAVDRDLLSRRVVADSRALAKLEAIVHPLVRERQLKFRKTASEHGLRMAVLEIPLLVETGGEYRVDLVVLVTAPPEIRSRRVSKRPGMTEKRFRALTERQLPESAKRSHAHVIIDNGGEPAGTAGQVADLVKMLAATIAGR